MPLAIYVLGLAIFAQGTSELMLAGLLPQLAADLGVSIPDAGLLISAFAIGMLVGAPVLAVLTLRVPRRTAMLVFLAIFVGTHVAGALTPNYGVLFATRIVGAVAYAGFWAATTITALRLVAPTGRGRAMAVLVGGLTLATVIGLPGGTFISEYLGWRAAFWAVAIMSALAMVAVAVTVPAGRPDTANPPRLRLELRAMAQPQLWIAYAVTALSVGATLVTFSYLAPLLIDVTGLPTGWVPVVLVIYGVGSAAGIAIGGRIADTRPFPTLYVGLSGVVVVSVALALTARFPVVVVVLVGVLGAFGFLTNPAVNTRVFALGEAAPTLAVSTNISAFNIGITVAPWLGGLAIGAGFGYPSVAWIGAGLGLAALATVLLAAALAHRSPPVREPVPASG
ncbi:Cmx/CmrA family chloramphenicol efflux MFS transporter [Pseudonocardia sp. GCM10023141]|uniref:Cmx/CmrA family chloramphenicol efflux MFS transporter n=1 Tax=Pseudonocardia sp. GCM10023141 TaxID=3252653 RepID=UPI003620C90C